MGLKDEKMIELYQIIAIFLGILAISLSVIRFRNGTNVPWNAFNMDFDMDYSHCCLHIS